MNFSQLHERLRAELLRRINGGSLTAAHVARQSGVQPPHISNFLHHKRSLSLPVLDRILAALGLSVADLLPTPRDTRPATALTVPLISQDAAIYQDHIPASSVIEPIHLPAQLLAHLRAEHGLRRPTRDRYVAVRISAQQAHLMRPILREDALLILDRHSTLPTASTTTRHIYAVRIEATLRFAFVTYQHNHLVLRPNAADLPLHIIPVAPQFSPSDYITARVCATLLAL